MDTFPIITFVILLVYIVILNYKIKRLDLAHKELVWRIEALERPKEELPR